jgi:hypothetical protein
VTAVALSGKLTVTVGVRQIFTVLSPSWPNQLPPQHLTVPFASSAQV